MNFFKIVILAKSKFIHKANFEFYKDYRGRLITSAFQSSQLYTKLNLSIFTVTPSCGATIKQNLSYYIQEQTQNPPQSNCMYKICPVASDVNRIRLDFTVIATLNYL